MEETPSLNYSARGTITKTLFVAAVLVAAPAVFLLANAGADAGKDQPVSVAEFKIVADKPVATYYRLETPTFQVQGAQPGSNIAVELFHNGRKVTQHPLIYATDERGVSYFRTSQIVEGGGEEGVWQVAVQSAGREASLDFTIHEGCPSEVETSVSTDQDEYRVGDTVKYTVHGPPNLQVRWFGLSGRDEQSLNLVERNAYYPGEVTDGDGTVTVEAPARMSDPEAALEQVSYIVTLCEQTAQVHYAIQR